MLERAVPVAFKLRLFKCFLDAAVSEQIARRVAMKAATENAGDLIKELSQQYNRARQAKITKEISELIAGSGGTRINGKPPAPPARRSNLDEVVRDAEILLAKGYEKAGQWDLAQCANHLAELDAVSGGRVSRSTGCRFGLMLCDDAENDWPQEADAVPAGKEFPGRQADDAADGRRTGWRREGGG